MAWLEAHRWVWDPTTLDELINQRCAGGARLLWLCGHAANALDLAGRFDVTVLLRLDLATMLARLSHPERGNDFGRVGHSRQHLRDNFEVWQRHLESRADVVIDATADLDTVADHLVRRAGSRVWR